MTQVFRRSHFWGIVQCKWVTFSFDDVWLHVIAFKVIIAVVWNQGHTLDSKCSLGVSEHQFSLIFFFKLLSFMYYNNLILQHDIIYFCVRRTIHTFLKKYTFNRGPSQSFLYILLQIFDINKLAYFFFAFHQREYGTWKYGFD